MKRGSMRCPIPENIREVLANDPWMRQCCLAIRLDSTCDGPIQWHHHFRPAGKRVNEKYAILPLCTKHHRQEAKYTKALNLLVRQRALHFGENIKDKYPRAVL